VVLGSNDRIDMIASLNLRISPFTVPEIIDPVFTKTSQNARFLLSENERFGLVFVKTGSINSGTGFVQFQPYTSRIFSFFPSRFQLLNRNGSNLGPSVEEYGGLG